jgi:hypothetical protein
MLYTSKYLHPGILLCCILFALGCNPAKNAGNYPDENPPADKSKPHLRIKWEVSERKLSHDTYYAEYGRIRKVGRDSLILTYNCGAQGHEWDNVGIRRSFDNGDTWLNPSILKPVRFAYRGLCTPDILPMKNGWLMMALTGRCFKGDTNENHVLISYSKDKGTTWSTPTIVARGRFWEPNLTQLPDGEIEMYYTEEFIHTHRSVVRAEQRLMLITSKSGGVKWSKPVEVAFTKHIRDGMAVPVVLKDDKGILIAVESVNDTKSPQILWSSLKARWHYNNDGNFDNHRRWIGTIMPIWGGAPYLLQLPTGETLISLQTECGRPVKRYTNWKKNTVMILAGNSMARQLSLTEQPYKNMPKSQGAYFSSMYLKNDSTLLLLTSRNFTDNHSAVYEKVGHIFR